MKMLRKPVTPGCFVEQMQYLQSHDFCSLRKECQADKTEAPTAEGGVQPQVKGD